MNLTLHIWRQKNSHAQGKMVRYEAREINPDMSFLEMLDVVNWNLNETGEEPIAFDHDCREGICGSCGMMINGIAHGPQRATAACQLHMRHFNEGDTIFIEPWRSEAFPVIRDLVVDRSAFDRIIQAVVTYPSAAELRPKPTPYPSQSRMQSWQWMLRHVLGAAHVSLLAPTDRLPFSRALKSHI